jgi:hypothetical protein
MSEEIKSHVLSRRSALSLLGLAALTLAMPATVLTISNAEAQQPSPPVAPPSQTPTTATPQTGTERRQARRTARTERRQARRTARAERRKARRTARTERRKARRTGTTKTSPQ